MINNSSHLNRRAWLKTGSLVFGSTLLPGMKSLWANDSVTELEPEPKSFRHRGYLGWITDLASEPDTHAAWPSMRLDNRLLEDYRATFKVLKQLGFNELSVWGLYVSRAWPVDIPNAVEKARGVQVETLIASAHQHGIRVLSGLGVYSWGFNEIIKAFPQLSKDNPQAMCAHEPEAWKWMQKVIDFVFTRFDIDGVSMQSADQGRCRCDPCKAYSDAEYHALLNTRAADYIRSRWPKKTIGVNSWGMRFNDPAALPSLVKMSRSIDYLIDVHDTGRRDDPQYRKKLVQSLKCDFGTLGGPQVEPPQHWQRDRWLLPSMKRCGEHLQQLAADGGRACEFYYHILANPGDEISLWVAGKVLSDPAVPLEKHIQDSVEAVFQISQAATRDRVVELLLRSEDAYFQYLPAGECGTISMEPLVSDHPGSAVYLSQRLNRQQRETYGKELQSIQSGFKQLIPDIPHKGKVEKIVRCIDQVLQDLDQLKSG